MEIFKTPNPKLFQGTEVSFDEEVFIENIKKIYIKEYNEFIKNTSLNKFVVIPVIIKDKDDDYFYISDMYDVSVEKILGFNSFESTINKEINFPAKKDDYADFYNLKGNVIKVLVDYKKDFKYLNYFNKDIFYKLFDKHVLKRYELKINISDECKVSPVSAKIKEIKNDNTLIVFDNDEQTEISVNPKYLCVVVNQEVLEGDLLEKKYQVYADTINNQVIVKKIDENSNLKNYCLPIDVVKFL